MTPTCIHGFNPRPREEGDDCGAARCEESPCFNPRPREEGDFKDFFARVTVRKFQSTPS